MAEESQQQPPLPSAAQSPDLSSQLPADVKEAVDDFKEIAQQLHGNDPAWVVPPLDERVQQSLPNV